MGFVLDEKTSNFVWLYEAFMRSMGECRHPITLMTDQAPSIAAAIREIFSSTRHRLCTWHLGENSKTNIGGLIILKGFPEVFDYLLKYCESLLNFNITGPDGLSDFYSTFLDVTSEWRSKESKQDLCFLRGNCHLAVANVSFLIHAREIYTISVYVPNKDIIRHEVTYEKFTFNINCTCKYWSEMGLLCGHSLRIYNIHCVQKIPEQNIVKRWTKKAMCSHVSDEET
ncbi:uncharacterized protein LOC110715121 [Chenopodium quinoa]|uniref:uncharacterized protein LOC110715121 n=1 Tax=Chenopodium quinoa TaxID=63459 RepID=UPI000B77EE17|nr:uncharacterized protein LOC110715121 [Chenopodium quinoa]